jgi:hypothetical protein
MTDTMKLLIAFRDATTEVQIRKTAWAVIDHLQSELRKSNKAMQEILPLLEQLDREMKEENDERTEEAGTEGVQRPPGVQ